MSPPSSQSLASPEMAPVGVDVEPARWFDEEVKPHEPALRAYLQRRYPSLSEVDDVVQETFLKAFVARKKGRLTAAKGFLFTVAGNITISLFRRRKFLAPEYGETPAASRAAPDVDVIENVCSQDEQDLVAAAIAELPACCRNVILRRLFHGMDYRTIAQELGISEATVRVQTARGIRKCSEYLKERGVIRRRSA